MPVMLANPALRKYRKKIEKLCMLNNPSIYWRVVLRANGFVPNMALAHHESLQRSVPAATVDLLGLVPDSTILATVDIDVRKHVQQPLHVVVVVVLLIRSNFPMTARYAGRGRGCGRSGRRGLCDTGSRRLLRGSSRTRANKTQLRAWRNILLDTVHHSARTAVSTATLSKCSR